MLTQDVTIADLDRRIDALNRWKEAIESGNHFRVEARWEPGCRWQRMSKLAFPEYRFVQVPYEAVFNFYKGRSVVFEHATREAANVAAEQACDSRIACRRMREVLEDEAEKTLDKSEPNS